ncbi:MAG: KH domain-containing protein [Actinomycetota bacterium]|jgi:hypothetical protein|nr:KH domain-containing protein [Actinomycetota bacterium]
MSDLFESPSFPEPEVDDEDGFEEEEATEQGVAPAEANRIAGGRARAVLEHVATSIVEDPDAVEISSERGRSGLVLSLHVGPSDMGRVIGKRGRVAQAMRTLVRAAAATEGADATVDIVD